MKQTPSHPSSHQRYHQMSTASTACERNRSSAEVVDLTQDEAEFEDHHAVVCNTDMPAQPRLAKRASTRTPGAHQQARHKAKVSTSHAASRTQHATQNAAPPATESTRQRTTLREVQLGPMKPNNDLDCAYQRRSGTNLHLPACRLPPGINMRSSVQAAANQASQEQPQRAILSQLPSDVRLQDSAAKTARVRHSSTSQQLPATAQSHVQNESSQSTPAFRRGAVQHHVVGRSSATPLPAPARQEARSVKGVTRERQPPDAIEASSPSNEDDEEAAISPNDDHIMAQRSRRHVPGSSRNAYDETDAVTETQSRSLIKSAEMPRALTAAGDGRCATSSDSSKHEDAPTYAGEQKQNFQPRARQLLGLDGQDHSSRPSDEKDKRGAKVTGEESGRNDSRKKQAGRQRRVTDRATPQHREIPHRPTAENAGGESKLRPMVTNSLRGTQTQHKADQQPKAPAAGPASANHSAFPDANEDQLANSSVNANRSAESQRRHPEIRDVRRSNALVGMDEAESRAGQQALSSVQRRTNTSTPASGIPSPRQRQKRRQRSTEEAANLGVPPTTRRTQPSSPFHDRQLAPGIWWASSEESDFDDEVGIGGFSDQSDDGSAIDADYFSHPTRWSQDDGEELSITSDDAMQIGEIGTSSEEQDREQEASCSVKPQDEAPCLTNELAHAKAHVKHMLQDLIVSETIQRYLE